MLNLKKKKRHLYEYSIQVQSSYINHIRGIAFFLFFKINTRMYNVLNNLKRI